MRKVLFCLAACVAAGPGAFAQVGVRTENPQGMFHVDALYDTVGNQHTGDDVIVTDKGNLAIGMIPPPLSEIKLIVTDGGTIAAPKSPFRIIDGYQAEGRVLTSDATGQGRWADLPSGFSLGEAYEPLGVTGGLTIIAQGNNNFTDLGISFRANKVGLYAFEVRWWARVNATTLAGTHLYQHFRLLRAGSLADQFEAYTNTLGNNGTALDVCTISFTMYGQATVADQEFRLQARAATPLGTENNSATLWTRAWVKVVRMN
jgi:hypothetical protein